MGFVEEWQAIRAPLDAVLADLRVTPSAPKGRRPRAAGKDDLAQSNKRDDSSSWTVYIAYEDATGTRSERRITCRQLQRSLAGDLVVNAFCHERSAMRAFRMDRIIEVVDLTTGEIIDAYAHFDMLQAKGLPIDNKGLATIGKMLVFMTLCDGHGHDAEWQEVERSLESYALRFGADDAGLEQALRSCRALAPDGPDFIDCVGALYRTPEASRRQLARFTIDSCARIVDADGRHSDEEVHWGNAIGAALKRLAV